MVNGLLRVSRIRVGRIVQSGRTRRTSSHGVHARKFLQPLGIGVCCALEQNMILNDSRTQMLSVSRTRTCKRFTSRNSLTANYQLILDVCQLHAACRRRRRRGFDVFCRCVRHRVRRRDHDTGRRPVRFTLCVGAACSDWRICAWTRTSQRMQPGVLLLLPRSGADRP
jgi:hypothetical protein